MSIFFDFDTLMAADRSIFEADPKGRTARFLGENYARKTRRRTSCDIVSDPGEMER